jgi:hypothetical protein
MKPYAPPTNLGRKRSVDDIHHRTADQPRADAEKSAKVARHGARQAGKREALESLDAAAPSAP